VGTSNVLAPVYEGVGQEDPTTEEPVPYLLKGIDADDSGTFDLDEYGVYRREDTGVPEDALRVTAYYDFNGAIFHDGVQVTMDDLLFSYSMSALVPTEISLDSVKDKSGLPGTNFTTSHWLHIWPVVDNWDLQIPVGDISNIFALRFEQVSSYANFVKYTLNGQGIHPRHIWEGTGKLCLEASAGTCTSWKEPLHADYGIAYNETTHNGVPVADPNHYNMDEAKIWGLSDSEVIGSGAMEFDNWTPGVSAKLTRYEGYKADALDCEKVGTPPVCTGNFYSYMHQPYIGGMLFKIYKTAQAAVFALRAGEIDVVSWSVPPEFVGGLLIDPNIGIFNTAEKGFFYISYNMRKSPFGYPNNDPTQGDDGLWLRKAMAHVIDKKTIVTTLLQNFGAAGDQPVSPSFTKWYNASVTKYDYDLEVAKGILDDYYTVGGLWADPVDPLGYGTNGFRKLPSIGAGEIEILCPQADYDPIRAQACNMIAGDMQKIGLNADAKLVAFGEIVERLNNRDMQMWVLGWRIGSDPPDYYYAFFYSGNARAGQNYPGFQNETFDGLITAARAELDLDKQTKIIKQCSGLLTDAQPYDVLYFRTNIEPYRADRFVNWTVGPAGSIFGGSPQSWIGIHPPVKKTMKVLLEVRSSMKASGINETSTQAVTARVRNIADNTPKQGANVTISLAVPRGHLVYGTQQGISVSGLSDVNGNFIATYVAPVWNETVNDTARLTIAASAKFEDEETGQVLADVLIYPRGLPFLAVLTKWTVSDIVLTKDSVPLEVEVTDQDGITVNGAEVTVTPEVGGPTVSPDIGVTSGGKTDFIITAPKKVSDTANTEVDFLFSVQATAAGLASEPYQILLTVKEKGGDTDGFDMTIPAIGAAVAIAVVVIIASFLAVKKKPKRRRKRNK